LPRNDAVKDSITKLISKWQNAVLSARAMTEKEEMLQKEIQNNLVGVWIDKGPTTNSQMTVRFYKDLSFAATFRFNPGINANGTIATDGMFEYRWTSTKYLGTIAINGKTITPTIKSEFQDGEPKDPYDDGSYYSLWKINGKWTLFFLRKDSGDDSAIVYQHFEQNDCLVKK